MKNRKKRKQREEVRKILKAMQEELARQRLAQENGDSSASFISVAELLKRSGQSL